MRISDRYIGKQVLMSTVFAIVVLTLVLVMGTLFQQIRPLLVEQGISLGLVVRFALNILPFSMMFTIPWGFLSAVLLVFGRLSSEQELTGFRVAGISLPRLAVPVFVIALLFSGFGMWLNVTVAPRAKASLDTMIYDEAMRDPRSLLDPGAVQSRFTSQKVFTEGRDENGALLGFHMYQFPIRKPKDTTPPAPPAYVHAGRVELLVDKEKQSFRLTLDNAFIESAKPPKQPAAGNTGTMVNANPPKEAGKPGAPPEMDYDLAFTEEAKYWLLDFSDSRPKKPRSGSMTTDQIHQFIVDNPTLSHNAQVAFRADITKRYCYSMACLAFAFVGVPLALKSRREDTSSGIMLSMLIAAAYFLSSSVADQIHSDQMVTVALWLPNVICVIIGIVLFRRARFR